MNGKAPAEMFKRGLPKAKKDAEESMKQGGP